MDEKIIKDYGWCKVIKKNTDFFMTFDAGQIVIEMKTYKITEAQAEEACKSEEVAEKIAFEIQKNPPLS